MDMVAATKDGKAVYLLKRTEVGHGVDKIVEEFALSSLNAGLVATPVWTLPEPTVMDGMEALYDLVSAPVKETLRTLSKERKPIDRVSLIRMLASTLAIVPRMGSGMGIVILPIRKATITESNRENRSGENFGDLKVKSFDKLKAEHAAFIFRSNVSFFNRRAAFDAYTAYNHLMDAWLDPSMQAYQLARVAKFRKRIGTGELSELIHKKETAYVHVIPLLGYYAQLFKLSSEALFSITPTLDKIGSRDNLMSATLLKMNQQLAICAYYDLLPILKAATADGVVFMKGDPVNAALIETSRYLIEAIGLLEPLLRRDITTTAYGKLGWTTSPADRWKLTFARHYLRMFYLLGNDYADDPSKAISPFYEDGPDKAVDMLSKDTGIKSDIKKALELQIKAASTMEINGDRLETVFPLGIVDKPDAWDKIWTTEGPGETARQYLMPLPELFSGIPNEHWDELYSYCFRAIKHLSGSRLVRPFAVEAPFEGLPDLIPLEASSMTPLTIGEIHGLNSIKPKDPDVAIDGTPILPRRWGNQMSIEFQKSIPEHTLDFTIQ